MRGRVLERLLKVNVYYRAYAPMSLDQHAELERWRALGVRTPAAPRRRQSYSTSDQLTVRRLA